MILAVAEALAQGVKEEKPEVNQAKKKKRPISYCVVTARKVTKDLEMRPSDEDDLRPGVKINAASSGASVIRKWVSASELGTASFRISLVCSHMHHFMGYLLSWWEVEV